MRLGRVLSCPPRPSVKWPTLSKATATMLKLTTRKEHWIVQAA
jgi:hypothetical protein